MEEYFLNNLDLKNLLKEYEQKRELANRECEKKIEDLYLKNPKLSNLVDNINKTSINLSKSILLNNKEQINFLQKKLEELKNEKINILKNLNISSDFFEPK